MMNYELYDKIKCPKCKEEFTCIEDLDTEIDMKEIKIAYSGYCDECESYFHWDVTYKLDKISPLKSEEESEEEDDEYQANIEEEEFNIEESEDEDDD